MKPKPIHPADAAMAEAVASAAYFTVCLHRVPEIGTVRHDLKRLDQAREAGRLLVQLHKTSTRPLVYAVTPDGRSFLVPDDYQPAPMEDAMTLVQLAAAITDGTLPTTETAEPSLVETRYVSKPYGSRRACVAGAKRHAESHDKTYPADYSINELTSERFTFETTILEATLAGAAAVDNAILAEQTEASRYALPNPDALAAKPFSALDGVAAVLRGADPEATAARVLADNRVTPAPEAGKPATEVDLTTQLGVLGPAPGFDAAGRRVTDDDGIPKFLDRVRGRSTAEIDAERTEFLERAKRGQRIKHPGGKLKTPTGRRNTGLGQAVGEAKSAGAKPAGSSGSGKPQTERKPRSTGGESKSAIVERLLMAAKGATRAELSEASGWPHVNLRTAAERAGKFMMVKGDRYRLCDTATPPDGWERAEIAGKKVGARK